jgi:hypothetical protein
VIQLKIKTAVAYSRFIVLISALVLSACAPYQTREYRGDSIPKAANAYEVSQQNGEYLFKALFTIQPDRIESTYAWADLFWDKSGRLTVEVHKERLSGARHNEVLSERKIRPQGEKWARVFIQAYNNDRSKNKPFYLVSAVNTHDGFGRPPDVFSIGAYASREWINYLQNVVVGLSSKQRVNELQLSDVKHVLENYPGFAKTVLYGMHVTTALTAGNLEIAEALINYLQRHNIPVSQAILSRFQESKGQLLVQQWLTTIRAGDIDAAAEMLLSGKVQPEKESISEYRALALQRGNSRQLLALAATGDRDARSAAIARASNQEERLAAILEPRSMLEQDLLDVIVGKNIHLASKMRSSFKSQKSLSQSTEVAFKELVWAHGTFDDVMGFLSSDPRGTLTRAQEVAKTASERDAVEREVVKAIAAKLFIIDFVLEGTGRTRSADTDVIIGRKIGSEITSALRYSGKLDKSLFNPANDYQVKGSITLHIRGKENGERACGFLMMSKCEYKDEAYSESVNVPVTLSFTKGNSYQTSGVETIKWDAVSGGSGLASGRYFGGTRIRKADDLSLTFSLNSVEKM